MTDPDGTAAGLNPVLLTRARRAAWRAASWMWENPDSPAAVTATAGPLAAWMGQARDDGDLYDRIAAASSWTGAARRLAQAGRPVPHEGDGEYLAAAVADIYEYAAAVPGDGGARPGAAAGGLPGRLLFIYRCLLEHATAETPGRPAMDPDELISGAVRRARAGRLQIGPAEISNAVTATYRADPRDPDRGQVPGAARARSGAPRDGSEMTGPDSPAGPAGHQPQAARPAPFGPPGDGPVPAGPAW